MTSPSKARSLTLTIDQQRLGTLSEEQGLWSLTYAPTWLASPQAHPLSPSLPMSTQPLIDSGSQRPVQWYFDNLLPEEGQRTLLATDARIDIADAFGLLSHYGAESAGSLTLLPPGAPTEQNTTAGHILTPGQLSERIRALPRIALSHPSPKKMSLAGAQHKLAVIWRDGQIREPGTQEVSTHILKPDHHASDDYPHSVINEWFCMRLAHRLGLKVPPVHRLYVPEPVYLVQRFDRTDKGQRLHAIDGCQALNLSPVFKYQQASVEQCARLADLCRIKPPARMALFEWLVFNALIGNGDNHLKNISFMVSHEGLYPAPAYDLLSTAVYDTVAMNPGRTHWPHSPLAWPLPGASHFDQITPSVMLDAGDALKLSPEASRRIITRLVGQIDAACEQVYAQAQQDNISWLAQAPATERPQLASTLEGEARCLRAIHKVVIATMSAQLRT